MNATVVVLLDGGRQALTSASLREFRLRDAASRVVLVSESGARTIHQLAEMARAGLDTLYLIDQAATLERLARDVARYLDHALPWTVVQAVTPDASTDAVSILTLCIRLGDRPHKAEDVATWLQWDRKTVWRHLHKAHLRPVHELLDIGQLLLAAVLLDHRVTTVRVVAKSLKLGTLSLRRICKRETGLSPTQLRHRGAVKTVLSLLRIHSA